MSAKTALLQCRVGEALIERLQEAANKTHDGNISAFVRDALSDRLDDIYLEFGRLSAVMPQAVVDGLSERAKEKGLAIGEFIQYMLTKMIIDGGAKDG